MDNYPYSYSIFSKYSKSELQIVKEFYIGKNRYTEKFEGLIHELRRAFRYMPPALCNSLKEIIKLQKFIQDTFGFQNVSITINPSDITNTCTILPIGSDIDFRDPRKYIRVDKERIWYDKSAKYDIIMIINKELVANPEFTDAEITALVLHEIGHNFQNTFSKSCNSLSKVNLFFRIIKTFYNFINSLIQKGVLNITTFISFPILFPTVKKEAILFINDIKQNHRELCIAFDVFASIWGFIESGRINGLCVEKIIRAFDPRTTIIKQLRSMPSMFQRLPNTILGGYRGELIADNFSTIFGYSNELITCLNKMDKLDSGIIANQLVDKYIPIVSTYVDLLYMPTTIMNDIVDEHPGIEVRASKQIKYLERELLNQDLSPEIKKSIARQIDDLQKSLKECVTPKEIDPKLFTKLLRMVSLAFMKFSPKPNLFGAGVEKEIDDFLKSCASDNLKKVVKK